MRLHELTPMTKRTASGGSVTTVGGQEIARSTPKIGGLQSTSYADGSVKQTFQTTDKTGDVNIKQTKVNGKNVGMDIDAGAMSVGTTGTPQNPKVNRMKFDMGAGVTLSAKPGSATVTGPQGQKRTFGIAR